MQLARPMTAAERDYLELLKKNLDAALQQMLIAAGIAALPLGFLVSTLSSRTGFRADTMAAILATLILSGLTAAVLIYGGQMNKGVLWRAGDWQLRERLGEDLLGRTALSVRATLDDKFTEATRAAWSRRATEQGGRRYYLRVDGQRFEVSGLRWLAAEVGSTVQLVYAERSRVVLEVNGLPDRLSGPWDHAQEGPQRAFKPG
jgi:hypothetical protein